MVGVVVDLVGATRSSDDELVRGRAFRRRAQLHRRRELLADPSGAEHGYGGGGRFGVPAGSCLRTGQHRAQAGARRDREHPGHRAHGTITRRTGRTRNAATGAGRRFEFTQATESRARAAR